MKIDVTTPILNLDGTPVKDVTLRTVALRAMMDPQRGDDQMSGDGKAKLFHLAMKINAEDQPDLDIAELKLLRDRVDGGMTPLFVGRVREILDNKEAKPAA